MTGEEMEKAIEFLLNQQAQLTADVGRLDAAIKEMGIRAEEDRKFVREIIHEVARGIAELTVNAEADRQEFRGANQRAEADRQEFRAAIQRATEQANTDRQEFRVYIQRATEQAEADRAVIWAVVGEVHAINERVGKLESQRNRQQ